MTDQIIAEGVAGQEDLFFEGAVGGRFGFFHNFPVE